MWKDMDVVIAAIVTGMCLSQLIFLFVDWIV